MYEFSALTNCYLSHMNAGDIYIYTHIYACMHVYIYTYIYIYEGILLKKEKDRKSTHKKCRIL